MKGGTPSIHPLILEGYCHYIAYSSDQEYDHTNVIVERLLLSGFVDNILSTYRRRLYADRYDDLYAAAYTKLVSIVSNRVIPILDEVGFVAYLRVVVTNAARDWAREDIQKSGTEAYDEESKEYPRYTRSMGYSSVVYREFPDYVSKLAIKAVRYGGFYREICVLLVNGLISGVRRRELFNAMKSRVANPDDIANLLQYCGVLVQWATDSYRRQ